MVIPGANIVVGPYAGHSHIKEVEFFGSSGRAKDYRKDGRPVFAVLERSNMYVHVCFLNDGWMPSSRRLLDLFEWIGPPAFTKRYFSNRDILIAVLLLVDASVPQKIDLDYANWLGRNEIPMTLSS
ncbi:hypothetical protein MLD38_014191 [Melastoma candidum]|uniref:Uncharacterized protein n=1 Tax=Melastoma candidum TaxID=119954 RepID=A0ACB9RG64_9MYRT|nr:hypothetical protein MLD38_014191 [Melastoma candidum]